MRGLTVRATYGLEYDDDEGSNLAALCFHSSNWGRDRMEKERKKAFASVVVGGRLTCSADRRSLSSRVDAKSPDPLNFCRVSSQ